MLATDLCQKKLKFENIFSKIKGLSQEPLHQYYACLYSCLCIFHGESKYDDDNLNFELKKKSENFGLSSALHIRLERVNIKSTS